MRSGIEPSAPAVHYYYGRVPETPMVGIRPLAVVLELPRWESLHCPSPHAKSVQYSSNPNELYKGNTIWEYTTHWVHTLDTF